MAVTYSPEIAAEICERLAAGRESLRAICESDPRFPNESTVRDWAYRDVNGFGAQYTRARLAGYQVMADDTLEIADTTKEGVTIAEKDNLITGRERTETRRDMIEHRRLQVDTRKWLLSKVLPKIYGDRLAVEHSGEISIADRLRAGRKRVGKE